MKKIVYFHLVTCLAGLNSAFSQEQEREAVTNFQLSVSSGLKYINSFSPFNDSLSVQGIKQLNPFGFSVGTGAGIIRNNYNIQVDFSITSGSNRIKENNYRLDYTETQIGLLFGYNIAQKWESGRVEPFFGMGINFLRLAGRIQQDTTLLWSAFDTTAHNTFFDQSNPQYTFKAGVLSAFKIGESGNSQLFLKAFYSTGLIDYEWSTKGLPIKKTSGISIELGIRFLMGGSND